jgi:hypothetical protein
MLDPDALVFNKKTIVALAIVAIIVMFGAWKAGEVFSRKQPTENASTIDG